jgi:hypothetical protein
MNRYFITDLVCVLAGILLPVLSCHNNSPSKEGSVKSDKKLVSEKPLDREIPNDIKLNRDTLKTPEITQIGEEDNVRRYPTKLKFTSGKIIDVRDIDPYRALPYKLAWEAEDRLDRNYDLSELSIKEQDRILKGSRINTDAFRERTYLKLMTKEPVISIARDKVAISYHASYYSNSEDILATEGYALVYDNNGNKLYEIQDKKDGFYDCQLSEDGKYLMQKYGTDYGEDGGGQLESGFKFYDGNTGEKICELELGKREVSTYGFYFCTDIFQMESGKENETELFVLSLVNRIMYKNSVNTERFLQYPIILYRGYDELKNTCNPVALEKAGYEKINLITPIKTQGYDKN